MSGHREFSDTALAERLRALRARSASRPDDPGLVALWPAVREDRMAAACAELVGRGHPIQRVPGLSASPSGSRDRWAFGVADQADRRDEARHVSVASMSAGQTDDA